MFYFAENFNQDISSWNVNTVTLNNNFDEFASGSGLSNDNNPILDLLNSHLVFVNSGYTVGDTTSGEDQYTIDTSTSPFVTSQGITYVTIEDALENLDGSGNYVFTYNNKTYDIYINTWNVSLVTSMKGTRPT